MKNLLIKFTVFVFITLFESYGSLSESDVDSDSNRSSSASYWCLLLAKSLVGFEELSNFGQLENKIVSKIKNLKNTFLSKIETFHRFFYIYGKY